MTIEWPDARVDRLKFLFNRGDTFSEIAADLGTTRGAVIGKAHRLGLGGRKEAPSEKSADDLAEDRLRARNEARAQRSRLQWAASRAQSEATPGQRKEPKEIVELPMDTNSLAIPFADLRAFSEENSNQCRFIAAEPPGPDYIACGNRTAPGESYCGGCKRIVYQPRVTVQQGVARAA